VHGTINNSKVSPVCMMALCRSSLCFWYFRQPEYKIERD